MQNLFKNEGFYEISALPKKHASLLNVYTVI